MLDVIFNEDRSRLRKGHGANTMAVVRPFALGLVRTAKARHSLKTRRKLAGWTLDYLASLLGASARKPGFVALGTPRAQAHLSVALSKPCQTSS